MQRLLLAVLATTLVACSDATVCPADLRWQLAPRETTVTVNSRFNMRFTLLGCAGTRVLSDSVMWTSSDPSVATVDSRTGAVTAVRVGTVNLSVRAFNSFAQDVARLTVRN
jgi:hypothetical protein